ncbi:MAG: hypothetical protein CAPSK01_002796 [Candidatus Accumulibacter vicinus]|uniref:Uncharacterized protein n=1 Tax=Candidatus Accumulibacter vicinus TaxID=2954382 RepID=A0A084XZ60_9PROT|nr:MAG: hypothetical protein CAPSK01_002796 [Candidatus Accumulibacter vicinus]
MNSGFRRTPSGLRSLVGESFATLSRGERTAMNDISLMPRIKFRGLTVMTFPGTPDHGSHDRFPSPPDPSPASGEGRFESRSRLP